jgi:hypothetical protein
MRVITGSSWGYLELVLIFKIETKIIYLFIYFEKLQN